MIKSITRAYYAGKRAGRAHKPIGYVASLPGQTLLLDGAYYSPVHREVIFPQCPLPGLIKLVAWETGYCEGMMA